MKTAEAVGKCFQTGARKRKHTLPRRPREGWGVGASLTGTEAGASLQGEFATIRDGAGGREREFLVGAVAVTGDGDLLWDTTTVMKNKSERRSSEHNATRFG